MKRKLVKQGAATMMVSLPSKWVKKNSLVKGSEVEVIEKEGKLMIVGAESKKERVSVAKIDLNTKTESLIRTIITNAYQLGNTKLLLSYKDEGVFEIIRKVVDNDLIGFEVIKNEDGLCHVENLTEPSESQFDNIFSKVLTNIEEMFKFASIRLSGKKVEFENVENKILSFDNFCKRVITISSESSLTSLLWTFHSDLMNAQGQLYQLLKYLDSAKIESFKENGVIEYLNNTKNLYLDLKSAYEKKDFSILEKIIKEEKNLITKEGYGLLESSKYPIIVHHLMDVIKGIGRCVSSLVGVIEK